VPTRGTSAITQAPTRTVRTAVGTVGYRSFGSGPAVLLVTGFSASMDSWDPRFLAALSASHRVVVFDNAGVGETSPLRPPLTIDAMAQQTSALITALHLGKPAVLGWSMGGMIAQALAVVHPDQVGKLVLAATQPGTGKALPVPARAAAALSTGSPEEVLAVLFPKDQAAAARAYGLAVIAYPGFYNAPKPVAAAQTAAIRQWFAGNDPAGRKVSHLALPTLVADGTEDALDPVANDHQLNALIHRSTLTLYPDAGHAFLFQDEPRFMPILTIFLR
jgi:pimeloyl-ACP methyl ester carboxylesterase